MTEHRESPDDIVFGAFDPHADTEITERNLPHWFQPGSAIFVTFRTGDSMPRDVVLRWRRELEEWLRLRGYPSRLAESIVGRRLPEHDRLLTAFDQADREEFLRVSNRIFHRSLDECHGACHLKRPELGNIVADSIQYHDNTKYDLDRFIVMPNHVHVIVQFRVGWNLSTVSQSWMRYTSRLINKAIGATGPFWQPEPFDHIIRSADQFEYLQEYIAENPRKAGLSENDSRYWARDSS